MNFNKNVDVILSNFPNIVKSRLKDLPKNDYPVLNSFLLASCWIGWAMDQSLVSRRDLFTRLNSRNIERDISTFSQASKTRKPAEFEKIFVSSYSSPQKEKTSKSKANFLEFRFNDYYPKVQTVMESRLSLSTTVLPVK